MKILILTPYCYPEHAASSYLGQNRNEAFVKSGFDIVTYAPTPSRGISEEVRAEYLKNEHRCEYYMDGHRVVHRFSMFKEGNSPIFRALRYTLIAIKHFNRALFSKDARECDIMFIASTPPFQGALAGIIKKIRHIPLVYNLQDIFPDSLVGTGLAKKGGFLWKVGRLIENFTYRNADKIIVISQDFKHNIIAKGVPENKIEVIYNWVEQNSVVDVPRSENKLISKYGLDPSKFYVTYCGNIGLTQNMDMLLEVAKALEVNSDIHFVLVGNGAYKDELEKKICERNIENVTMIPFQPYEDISHVFSLGDVGIIISKPGVGVNSVPSKTWSVMSASRPVLANFDENELKGILEGNANLNANLNANENSSKESKPCGIFTKAGDKVAFTDAIIHLYQHPELCREYGANGRKFVMENLTKEVGTAKYVEVIKSVIADNK